MNWKRMVGAALTGALGLIIITRAVPQMLFWPHQARVAGFQAYATAPISPAVTARLLAAAAKVRSRSGYVTPADQHIFLTDGGWRWYLLALRSYRSFAISLPGTEAIIINQSDAVANRIAVRQIVDGVGGVRSLDGVMTHELTHGFLRARFGMVKTTMAPKWLIEGYCDYVADESSLGAEDVARLRAAGQSHPALPYFEGRQKIARLIEQQHMTIDQIMAQH